MKVEYVNPFVTATVKVLEAVLMETPVRGELKALPAIFTSEQLNVTVGITGDVQGSAIFGMSLTSADRIASKMIGAPIKTFDQLAASAIAELSNMISGNALSLLSEAGYTCDIAPPTLVHGTDLQISTLSIPSIVAPFTLSQGGFKLTIGVRARK